MWRCRMVDLLIRVLPVKAWQDLLIRRHVTGCAACTGKLAAREEALAVLVQERDLVSVKAFWPAISHRLRPGEAEKARAPSPTWRWVAVAAGLLAAVGAGLWLHRGPVGNDSADLNRKLQIDYIRIGGEPARAYVFQPQDVNMTLVWVEKNSEGE